MRKLKIMLKQYDEKEFQHIVDFLSENENILVEMLGDDVTEVLSEIGIPTNLKGYQYVKTAVELCVKDRDLLNSITKSLYPEVARLHHVNYIKVEHAIRHAIQRAWESNNPQLRKIIFGNTLYLDSRPTNSAFIAAIVDYVELQRL